MRSTPSAFRERASCTDSSISQPPGDQSEAEIRAKRGWPFGHTARTARAMSRARRQRLSKEPPYASVRVLERGERNSCTR